jgi:hypothetical protein
MDLFRIIIGVIFMGFGAISMSPMIYSKFMAPEKTEPIEGQSQTDQAPATPSNLSKIGGILCILVGIAIIASGLDIF